MYFCGQNMKPRAFDLKLKIQNSFGISFTIYAKDMTGPRSMVHWFIAKYL